MDGSTRIAVIATMALGSFGLTSEAALAAKNEAYAQKKAECKQDAKGKHFGMVLLLCLNSRSASHL